MFEGTPVNVTKSQMTPTEDCWRHFYLIHSFILFGFLSIFKISLNLYFSDLKLFDKEKFRSPIYIGKSIVFN